MVHQYAPPVNVSPLIKFTRWSLLISGIFYGALWNSRYNSYETRMRPIWDQEKKEREARRKAEMARKSAQDVADLAKLADSK